jgi:enoyl-CoA hydratase
MEYKTIELSINDKICTLKLNYPQKLNSLSQLFFDEFDHAVFKIAKDKSVRVLIIRGTDEVFSAGGDLKEIAAADYTKSFLMCRRVQESFAALQNLEIPVIAALSGIVFGGGTELSLHCDIRFVDENTVIRLPESDLGLIPGAGGISILSRYFSPGDSAYYLFTGNQIPLTKALENGLVQKISNSGEVYNDAINFAKELLQKSPESLAAIKKIIVASLFLPVNELLDMEAKEFSSVVQLSGREKINAFFELKKKK